ncbi:Glycosyl transferases group 1 [Rubripirellula obstinata]|uniref:Glycosyl transferases group 1 n=1 Tax=Rubripirellula obstinata TaxID=406547 RepID=A0A5B1CHJ5_9BACT|nr:glycosyltransferase family 4 protein [Rubripirellula obstinata]KAA1259672.1 Glycosyl transferases group 1 [Rubripirellula obstinata]
MRFLFIASGRRMPSTRFRIDPFIDPLQSAGHRCDVFYSFPEKYDSLPWLGWRLSQRLKRTVRHWHAFLAARRHYDAILIEREVFDDDTSELEEKFRQATPRLILDVDDGVFLRHREKFHRIAGLCDVAIAGNRFLAEYMEPLCQSIELIPTCIHLAEYPLRPDTSPDRKPTIGWMGTTHNVPFLEVAAPALRRIASEVPYRLLVVANTDERLKELELTGVDVEFRRWSPDREIADLHEMDIGLMPLPPDQEWMKYKCGLKLLQYLAVGTPGIASPIGVNAEIIGDGLVGRIASDETQWYESIKKLLLDTELRKELGRTGRQLVADQYSIEANWRKLLEVLAG